MLQCKEEKLRLELLRAVAALRACKSIIYNPFSSNEDVIDARYEADWHEERARFIGYRLNRG